MPEIKEKGFPTDEEAILKLIARLIDWLDTGDKPALRAALVDLKQKIKDRRPRHRL